MSKHTPGPWHTDKASPFTIRHADSFDSGDTIAHVNHIQPTGDTIANVRLMKASPDLLEACKLAHEYIVAKVWDDGGGTERELRLIDTLTAAIEKAEAAQ
jgi:hypothetical protein